MLNVTGNFQTPFNSPKHQAILKLTSTEAHRKISFEGNVLRFQSEVSRTIRLNIRFKIIQKSTLLVRRTFTIIIQKSTLLLRRTTFRLQTEQCVSVYQDCGIIYAKLGYTGECRIVQ